MNVSYDPEIFLDDILINTPHTIASLSAILSIPKKKLMCVKKLSKRDYGKINELREILEEVNCSWLNDN